MQAWCQKSSPFPQHEEQREAVSSSSESNEDVSAAGQKPHLLVRKSVKLRRGKKVLTQDMTHNSWLHSAPLLLLLPAVARHSKNGHVCYELGAKDVLSHFIFFVKETLC